MEKRRVLLIKSQPLLGEGLAQIFQRLEDVELVCLPGVELQEIDARLRDIHPDIVLLAGEKEDDQASRLLLHLLKQYEAIPIVWIELETNVLRLFTSHSLTANSAALIDAIRENNLGKTFIFPMEKKSGLQSRR